MVKRGADRVAFSALLLLAGLAAASTSETFVLRPFFWNLSALVWAVVIVGAGLGLGLAFFRLLRLPPFPEGRGFAAVLAGGAGLALLASAVLLLGLAGGLAPAWLSLLVVLSLAGGAPFLLRWWRGDGGELLRAAGSGWRRNPALGAAAGGGALLMLLLALAPTLSYDALTYHLEVPSRFLQAGRVIPIPENFASNYPLLGEMLYTLGLGLEGAALAQAIHFLFFLLTLLLAWTWARRFFDPASAAWGIALLATLPPFLFDALSVGTDWPVTFFTLGAVFLATSLDRSLPRMLLAGSLAGFAAGTKYPALAFALVLPGAALVAADFWRRRPWRPLLAGWAGFFLAGAAAASPWYLKNLFFTGDPFFPLFSAGSLGKGAGFSALLVDAHFASSALGDLFGLALLPFRLVFDFPAFQLPWSPGVVLLGLVPALLALRGSGKGSRFQLLWALSGILLWYATFQLGRFALPFAGVACLWLGAGLAHLLRMASPLPARVLAAGVALLLMANAAVFVALGQSLLGNLPPALGLTAPERYLEEALPPFRAIRYLERMDTPPGKVLFLGEMRGFPARFPREVPIFASANRLIDMARAGLPPSEMAAGLGRAGITHILFNPAELARLSTPGTAWALPPEGEQALKAFLARGTRKAFEAGGILVLEVVRD